MVTYDEWAEAYSPIQNPFNEDAPFGGCLFETFGEEVEAVMVVFMKDERRVWTVVEEDGLTFITNGARRVNRLGYLLTEKPACGSYAIPIPDPREGKENL